MSPRALLLLLLVAAGCAHGEAGEGAADPAEAGADTKLADPGGPGPILAFLPGPVEGWRMGRAVAFQGKILALGAERIAPPSVFEQRGRIEILDGAEWSSHRVSRKLRHVPWPGIDAWDPRTRAWAPFGPMPAPRRNAVPVVLGGKLYLVGGWPAQHSHRLDVFDPATGAWSEGPPTRRPRNHAAAVAQGGKLWVYGGLARDNGSCVDLVEVFDPATGAWSEAGAHPAACRFKTSAVAFGEKVYLFGGRRDGHRKVDVHDPTSGAFEERGELPITLYASEGAARLGDAIYLVEDGRRVVHRYDPASGTFAEVEAPPRFDRPGPLVALGGTVHLLGPGARVVTRPIVTEAPEPFAWRCAGVISQQQQPCVDCRHVQRDSKPRRLWSRALGVASPQKEEAARSVVARLREMNAEMYAKHEAALARFQREKAERAGRPPPEPDPHPKSLLTGGKLGPLGKGRDHPPRRPNPWRLDHTLCYGAPGGRFPSLGKDGARYSRPTRRDGKPVPWW